MPIAMMYEALTQEELQQIKIELEIPLRIPLNHLRYALDIFKPELKGWQLDIFGVRSDLMPPGTRGMIHKQGHFRNPDGSYCMTVGHLPEEFEATRVIEAEVELYVFSQRLSRPPSPAYAEEYWHPVLGKRRRYGGQDKPGGTDVAHLTRCFEMFANLRDFRFNGGRTRLEDDPGWRATMREIDAYLKKPGTSLEHAVIRFWDYLVTNGDLDYELDAEAEGIDIEERRRKAALSKLKKWRRRWKKLPESKKRS